MKKIPKIEYVKKTIDWSMPRWYINRLNDIIVLSTGEHGDGVFTGTALPCDGYPDSKFSRAFLKNNYKPLDFDVPFVISNKD